MTTITDQIEDHVQQAYGLWLFENCSDEIHTKEQLIEASEDGLYWSEFIADITANVQVIEMDLEDQQKCADCGRLVGRDEIYKEGCLFCYNIY